jgi:hypothetical protein
MKFIDVTENGSNLIKTIATDKIKSLETINLNTGGSVTLILFVNKTELCVNETKAVILDLVKG